MEMANPSDSEEEDYMSDAFLLKCQDTRPGLVSKETAKRHEKEKKIKENKTISKKQLESEKREEGLQNKIGADNKGFAMLAKMGFKAGMSLGKRGTGRSEPVPISVKVDRGGLGRDTEVLRKKQHYSDFSNAKRQKLNEKLQSDFRSRLSDKVSKQQTESDLYKSQKVCLHLDSTVGLTEPMETFFWPNYKTPKSEEEEEEEERQKREREEESDSDSDLSDKEDEDIVELEPSQKLELLIIYLRKQYAYCLWCGTSYNDAEDLSQNCPGKWKEDHDDF